MFNFSCSPVDYGRQYCSLSINDFEFSVSAKKQPEQLQGSRSIVHSHQLIMAGSVAGNTFVSTIRVSPLYHVSQRTRAQVRVSHMPRDPASGAHEISAFCLGHRSFVTCLTSVVTGAGETLLATGGGDATVRLWRPETGTLLVRTHTSSRAPALALYFIYIPMFHALFMLLSSLLFIC